MRSHLDPPLENAYAFRIAASRIRDEQRTRNSERSNISEHFRSEAERTRTRYEPASTFHYGTRSRQSLDPPPLTLIEPIRPPWRCARAEQQQEQVANQRPGLERPRTDVPVILPIFPLRSSLDPPSHPPVPPISWRDARRAEQQQQQVANQRDARRDARRAQQLAMPPMDQRFAPHRDARSAEEYEQLVAIARGDYVTNVTNQRRWHQMGMMESRSDGGEYVIQDGFDSFITRLPLN
jgi:hypothetical protein